MSLVFLTVLGCSLALCTYVIVLTQVHCAAFFSFLGDMSVNVYVYWVPHPENSPKNDEQRPTQPCCTPSKAGGSCTRTLYRRYPGFA